MNSVFRVLTNINLYLPQHLFPQFLFEKLSPFYYVISIGITRNLDMCTCITEVKDIWESFFG